MGNAQPYSNTSPSEYTKDFVVASTKQLPKRVNRTKQLSGNISPRRWAVIYFKVARLINKKYFVHPGELEALCHFDTHMETTGRVDSGIAKACELGGKYKTKWLMVHTARLIEKELLVVSRVVSGGKVYKISAKGEAYLQEYDRMCIALAGWMKEGIRSIPGQYWPGERKRRPSKFAQAIYQENGNSEKLPE